MLEGAILQAINIDLRKRIFFIVILADCYIFIYPHIDSGYPPHMPLIL